MFYVPDELTIPTQPSSLRLIQRFSDLFSKLTTEHDSHKHRFKTLDPDKITKRASLPGKPARYLSSPKQPTLCLPIIQEKRFLLKGRQFVPHIKTQTARKQPIQHQKRLSNFKTIQKHVQRQKAVRRMKENNEVVPQHFEPWAVSQDFAAFS